MSIYPNIAVNNRHSFDISINKQEIDADLSTKKILYVRADSISDNILASSTLRYIKEKYGRVQIIVACQENIAELYAKNPFIDGIIIFDKNELVVNESYRDLIIKKLNAINFDLAINSTFSRDAISDFITLGSKAPVTIGLKGDNINISAEVKEQNNKFYSYLIDTSNEHKNEINKHKDFLRSIDVIIDDLILEVFTDQNDEDYAINFFRGNNLSTENTILVYSSDNRAINLDIEKLARNHQNLNFILINEKNKLNYLPNLFISKDDNIRRSYELIKRGSFVISFNPEGAHLAVAAGIKNLVLTGGGDFGKYLPYSNLTSLISLPLDCYGCNWNCTFKEKFCLTKIDNNLFNKALGHFISYQNTKPVVYLQNVQWEEDEHPNWKWFNYLIQFKDVDVFELETIPPIQSINQLIQESEYDLQDGNLEKAEKLLKSALVLEPENIDALNNYAVIQILKKEWNEGLIALQTIIKLQPDNEIASENLRYLERELLLYNILLEAEDLITNDKFDEAEKHLINILNIEPEHLDALNDLAVSNILQGRYEAAYNLIIKILSIDPDNEAAANNLHFLKETHFANREKR